MDTARRGGYSEDSREEPMKRLRKRIAAVVLASAMLLPLPGCTQGGAQGLGAIAGLALSVGASVGSYFLIRELS
jgi:hypothetical protein